jgi:hypothetical protein
MTKNDKEKLVSLLDEYTIEKHKTCKYNCCNCEMGILESYGSGYSCAIDTVANNIEWELHKSK